MAHVHVQSLDEAAPLTEDLARGGRIALDCEAAGFHRYSDRLCLVQLTTDRATYLVDTLAFDPGDLLRGALEDPAVPVVMHGADFDLRLLARDLRIRLRGLFDTQIAAQLLGGEALGLAGLLEARLGIRLSKKFQRADWAERPLSPAMLEYAADDTRYLMRLADGMTAELVEARRLQWAQEECRALEEAAGNFPGPEEQEDPVVRIRGARQLSPRQLTAVREALAWRDEIARARDRATFRVVAEGPLIEAVAAGPRTIDQLREVKGFPPRLAEEEGSALLERLARVAAMRDDELVGYPRAARRGAGRPTPETEALAERLKEARNRKADELGLPRGTLLSNATLLEIARIAPRTVESLASVEGVRRWKAEALGEEFLKLIRGRG